MKEILVVGSGGREHALGWALGKQKGVEVYTTPGNAGTYLVGENLPIGAEDIEGLIRNAESKKYALTVVGPEGPLAKGIVNEFQKRKLPIFGPTQEAAQLEASKVWARHFMARHEIPQPKFAAFDDYRQAREYLENWTDSRGVVVKADELAAGKGVFVCDSQEEAQSVLRRTMVDKELGPEVGKRVVIEERLYGKEASVLAFTDGKTVIPLLPVEDYKPVFDGDKGPNTGGMGGVCPFWEVVSPQELEAITQKILIPTVEGMAAEGRPYKGLLYAGLMKDEKDKSFKVLEFNARFGDPETQVILPLLQTPLLKVLMAVVDGRLEEVFLKWKKQICVGVVLASEGYPEKPETGNEIFGLEEVKKGENILVFEAGTKKVDGKKVTDGGRVLIVVGLGKTSQEAANRAYSKIATPEEIKSGKIPPGIIFFSGMHYRSDVAQRGISRY